MQHKSDKTPEGDENPVEKRVDAMMDPKLPDPKDDGADSAGHADDALPPLDIFSDPKTAPDVPPEVLREIDIKPEKAKVASTKPEPEEPIVADGSDDIGLDDETTDQAVDDIARKESDEVLAAEDAKNATAPASKPKRTWARIFKKWWVWLIIVLAVLGGLYAAPYTRYHVAGLFMKQTFSIEVVDSTTNTPVSEAQVSLDGQTIKTDDHGIAAVRVPVGHHDLQVKKQYYKEYDADVLVPLWQSGDQTVRLIATGRQVPVKVINKITGQPVSDADVRVLDTKATTDKDGAAMIVLPTGSPTQSGTVQADGYTSAKVTVQVTSRSVSANTFAIVPAGRMYFLSNQSGTIDVASTNLDGSDRRTVLQGTGNEASDGTQLLASRDWQYLALLATRDSSKYPTLYIIDTAHGNKLTTVDGGSNTTLDIVGWSGHRLVYYIGHTDVPSWQSGGASVRSYDADTNKSLPLVISEATGSSQADAQYQVIWNTVLMGDTLVYTATWYQYPGYLNVSGKQDTLMTVQADGSNKKTVDTIDAATGYFGGLYQDKPQDVIVQIASGSSSSYYHLASDGTYAKATDAGAANAPLARYPVYFVSPDGNRTFWTETRDGRSVLLVGDKSGANAKQVATLDSGYTAYGWYTNNYLVVSYKGGELDILPATGLSGDKQPLKITDYFKSVSPSGVGYGGL